MSFCLTGGLRFVKLGKLTNVREGGLLPPSGLSKNRIFSCFLFACFCSDRPGQEQEQDMFDRQYETISTPKQLLETIRREMEWDCFDGQEYSFIFKNEAIDAARRLRIRNPQFSPVPKTIHDLQDWCIDAQVMLDRQTGDGDEWNDPAYIDNSDAVKLSENRLTLPALKKLLDSGTPGIRYRRNKTGSRCKVHYQDFKAYLKTLGPDIFSEKVFEAYESGIEERKKTIQNQKK